MNLKNMTYPWFIVKFKDGRNPEFTLNNMERIPERQLQLLILPLQRELRRVKQEAVKKANLEKAKIEFQQPEEDLDALAMGIANPS